MFRQITAKRQTVSEQREIRAIYSHKPKSPNHRESISPHKSIMSVVNASTLSCKYIFGLQSRLRQNVAFVDDHTICYPAGHYIVIYNLQDKSQKFISASLSASGISALAISPSKRFLALAETTNASGELGSVIHIFDLKTLRKRKVLANAESSNRSSFNALSFSSDNQLLLSLSSSPESELLCWNWSKAKILASTKSGRICLFVGVFLNINILNVFNVCQAE